MFVKTEPLAGATALSVAAPCRFTVLPDFFADDIVIDARKVRGDAVEIPGENFILQLAGKGEGDLFYGLRAGVA